MSRASESDVRMMIASQFAYLDTDGCEGKTVKSILDELSRKYEGSKDAYHQDQLGTVNAIKDRIEQYDAEDCGRWILREVSNSNRDNVCADNFPAPREAVARKHLA